MDYILSLVVCVLIMDTLNWLFYQPLRGRGLRWRNEVEYIVEYVFGSIPIVGLISLLIGLIMGMQFAYTLQQWGVTIFMADIISIAALRELAPLMSAILITGRSGSAFTAEIGTMKVSEEIDALMVMGLNPVKFLIVPKFLGMIIAVPCVTVLSMLIMIAGGFIVAVGILGMDFWTYFNQTAGAIISKIIFRHDKKCILWAYHLLGRCISWISG
jgi:phospholipid/cholesterol/gamma-HCH transport system permease protein